MTLFFRDQLHAEGFMTVKFVRLDVTDAATIHAAKETIEKAEEKLDGLVNNAGMSSTSSSRPKKRHIFERVHCHVGTNSKADQNAATIALSTARDMMEVNYFGVIQTTVALLPLLRKSTNGVIVNVSSIMGSNAFQANPNRKYPVGAPANTNSLVAYSSSKAALNSYTIALAHELKGEGIKVNSVTPGLTSSNLSGGVGKTSKAAAEVLLPWALLEEDGPTGMRLE